MRSDIDHINWSRTYDGLRGDMKRLRKSLAQDRSGDIELEVCAFGRVLSVKCEGYIRSLGLAEFFLSCVSLADYEDKLSI